MALSNYMTNGMFGVTANPVAPPTYNPNQLRPANELVQGSMEAMLNPNSSYIQNARQRGTEIAATRGGINSSIAAGASERAAIDAAAPLAQQALNIDQTREGVAADEWMTNNNFSRAMLGQYSQQAFGSSLDMLKMMQQYAMEDPELYTPEVTSGMSNFFNRSMNDMFGKYFNGA